MSSSIRRPIGRLILYRVSLDLKRVPRGVNEGGPSTISIGDVSAGHFTGELRLTVYRSARLMHVETVIHTDQDRRAILYDAGLALESPGDDAIRVGRHRGKA